MSLSLYNLFFFEASTGGVGTLPYESHSFFFFFDSIAIFSSFWCFLISDSEF